MPDTPGNQTTTASITVGGTYSDTLETLGDHDWIRLNLTAGQSVTIFVDGITLEDSYLRVRNSAGTLLYENDDIVLGVNRDSQLSFTATTTGTYYIDVGSFDDSYTGTYQVSVTTYTPPPLASYDTIADQLVNGYWGGDFHRFDVTQGGSITVNITGLTVAGQTLARAALQEWSDIIGVNFVEVTTGGQIVFDDNQSGAATDGTWSNHIITSEHVNVSTQWLATYGTGLNSYSFQTYVHEIGHALGLGHAGNYNGTASYPYDASFSNDAWVTSIMSYFSPTENTYFAGQGFTENFVVTPAIADIIAMSELYGLSTTTRTGNTTYGFNSNAGSNVYNAVANPGVAYCIFDSGGTDTLDYSGFSTNQVINLNPETFSSVGPGVGNVSIARGVVIENAVGGTGNDTITGNDVANVLTGNAGNDILNGRGGADTLVGGLGNDMYVVDQSNDTIIEAAGQGQDVVVAKVDYTLGTGVSVEAMTTISAAATTPINLTGNELAQSIYGNAGDNMLNGGGGGDYLIGGLGNDTYVVRLGDTISELSGEGNDTVSALTTYKLGEGVSVETMNTVDPSGTSAITLAGNEFAQSIYGNAGNNMLDGKGAADTLIGGFGNDGYVVDQQGDVIVELSGQGDDVAYASASYVLGAGVSIESITTVNQHATTAINLTGNELVQTLYGNAGDNILDGGGGADRMIGSLGNDRYVVDQQWEIIVELPGEGEDVVQASSSFTLGAGVSVEAMTTVNENATTAINLTGNEFDQSLYGNAGNNILDGGGGADRVFGGAGNDWYFVDQAGDAITEVAGGGEDTVFASVSYTLGAGVSVEAMTTTDENATTAINLTGNEFDQSLYGNAGNNILAGGGGADRLFGGAGNDTFVINGLPGVVSVADYGVGDVIDVTQLLSVASGTDVVNGGFVRFTAAGQLQVDANGGGDSYLTVANVSGSGDVAVRYLAAGSATDVSLTRSASQDPEIKAQSTMTVMAVAAAGMVALVPTETSSSLGDDSPASISQYSVLTFHTQALAPNSFEGDHARPASSLLSSAVGPPAGAPLDAAPFHLPAQSLPLLDLSQAQDPTQLLAGTGAPIHAAIVNQVPLAAQAVAMPSAEMLATANSDGEHGKIIGQVLAEALQAGDQAPNLDALLKAIPVPGAEHLADALADGASFHFAGAASFHSVFAVEMLAAHVDAPAAT